ncbi:MAG: M20/M25/M40 family metallo-hydrolase [Halobacteriaceae archaeon]
MAASGGRSLREFVEELIRFESVTGAEGPAQSWFEDQLQGFGFETYTWEGDAERLADHPSFPDDPTAIDVADRPSVGGVLEFGDPDAGETLVLNGHVDVVPVEEQSWTSPPFEATWLDDGARLRARGAADMKSSLAACLFAALDVRDRVESGAVSLDGRVVVESVVDEEAGGIGATMAALQNPYLFDRDAAIVGEPTQLRPYTAAEGSVMKRLQLTGRSAHAATRWRGESVLPHFIAIYEAFMDLEAERATSVTHPLYERFDNPWPVNVGTVNAGAWASSVPADLVAELRLGVAPGETVDEVEAAFEERLAAVVADSEWLADHPPAFERFSVQFEPAVVDEDEPVVDAVQAAMQANDQTATEPLGATYGADSRHYLAAGIPTVMFGPGTIEQAHFPDETIEWADVETARRVLADAVTTYLRDA